MAILRKPRLRVYVLGAAVFGLGVFAELLHRPDVSQAAEPIARIILDHKSPDIKTLPAGSHLLPIVLTVQNTRATDLKIRVVADRDGRYLDVVMPRGVLNPQDNPVYQVQIPAPASVLTYQFVVEGKEGDIMTSARYVVRRACLPTYRIEVPKNAADAEFKREIGDLISDAKKLEVDITNYDSALRYLNELKGLVNE